MLLSLLILIAVILVILSSIAIYVSLRIIDLVSMPTQENIILGVLITMLVVSLTPLFLGWSYYLIFPGV